MKVKMDRKLTAEEEARARATMESMLLDTPEKKAAHEATFNRNVKEWEGLTPAQQAARLAEGSARMEAQWASGNLPKYANNANFECPPGAKCANPGSVIRAALGDLGNKDGDGRGNMGIGMGNFMANSASVVAQAMQSLKGAGVQGIQEKAKSAAQQSLMSRWTEGPMIKPEDDLPSAPGFAYLNHLFNATGAGQKIKEKQKEALTKGMNLMTNAMDGVRTAVKMLGVAGDNNVDGLPLEMKDVMKIFHGDKADEMDDISRNEFMREIGDGNTKIDRKKVRKFVNQDGSLTWEILNDDKKTVMSRFTFGEYNGTKLFAQGGYKQFGQLLREARQKLGPDTRGEFDSIRRHY